MTLKLIFSQVVITSKFGRFVAVHRNGESGDFISGVGTDESVVIV